MLRSYFFSNLTYFFWFVNRTKYKVSHGYTVILSLWSRDLLYSLRWNEYQLVFTNEQLSLNSLLRFPRHHSLRNWQHRCVIHIFQVQRLHSLIGGRSAAEGPTWVKWLLQTSCVFWKSHVNQTPSFSWRGMWRWTEPRGNSFTNVNCNSQVLKTDIRK